MTNEIMGRNPDRLYTTDAIQVEWEAKYCIHAARCIMSLPEVFDPRRRPWVDIQAAPADAIAEAVMRCPTGALHFKRLDGGPQEPVPDETAVVPLPNGPLLVRGDVTVEVENGGTLRHDSRMALCRCGHSANKPFCDNSHLRVGFHAP
jgi:uncharacterized Fe-S cluster protein YjdI